MATDLSADRWAQVNEILRQAIELPPAARREFVQTACGEHLSLCQEVLDLLTAYEADEGSWNFGSSPLVGYALRALAARQTASVLEDKVGPYRILRELGTGGMRTVYLAVRDDLDFEQQVAIKIGHQYASNRDFLQRRLRTERAILARLDHPNIARLLDGGTTQNGLPFFVMEYVPGVPITAYCRQRQLTTRQRLEMFQSVCHAVHYAHQNLVIHRDLKPGNILVTEDGVPKLIDFGIAKLLDEQTSTAEAHTVTRQRAMTVPYASPEQVRGEAVTTATDVYALGVLLYELLTGCLPFTCREGQRRKAIVGIPHSTGRAAAAQRGSAAAGEDAETVRCASRCPAGVQPGTGRRPGCHRHAGHAQGPTGAVCLSGTVGHGH
ncbi:serine/threonine-protein kinase [Chloracidobacterium thermophilum]|uniref:serine/threonine-protein kinase n=1 Tax=Chloracidobacterium thermophilum TaxID=458033 RepID=UPI000738B3CB|nr:serine/threonine-protein kinase [Chloracidobacterium thermophilum]